MGIGGEVGNEVIGVHSRYGGTIQELSGVIVAAARRAAEMDAEAAAAEAK
jgi:hypothetical protein